MKPRLALVETCQKLYEATKWESYYWYMKYEHRDDPMLISQPVHNLPKDSLWGAEVWRVPAYDVDALLDNLPYVITEHRNQLVLGKVIASDGTFQFNAFYVGADTLDDIRKTFMQTDPNPAEALAKLALKLKEEGLLE